MAPAIAFTTLAIQNQPTAGNCDKPVFVWILVSCGTLVAHFFFAVYLLVRMNLPYDDRIPQERDFSSRAKYVICYDVVIALWILLCIFTIVVS